MKISIISPVYFAEKILSQLVKEVKKTFTELPYDYELVLVDDGSGDQSWEVIEDLVKEHSFVRGIKLSRNFGQHYALTAGIKSATGDVNIIIDCDLQDPPSNIPFLIDAYKEGNEIVFTQRDKRKHGLLKSFYSKVFNWSFKYFSDQNFDVNMGTMILFSVKAKEAFLKLEDYDRLYLQLFKWIGLKNTTIVVKHSERISGKSTYTIGKLFALALQGFTSFSNKLLKISIAIGLIFSLLSFLSILVIAVMKYLYGFQTGWASIISTIFLAVGAFNLS